jgi:hypothetical protein
MNKTSTHSLGTNKSCDNCAFRYETDSPKLDSLDKCLSCCYKDHYTNWQPKTQPDVNYGFENWNKDRVRLKTCVENVCCDIKDAFIAGYKKAMEDKQ